jgi:ABC-type antimicrobial peptide transport system permease subunit
METSRRHFIRVIRGLFPPIPMKHFMGTNRAAISLALVGLYGVVSRMVGYRTREFGVRIALGATFRHLIRRILYRGMSLTLAGVVIGVMGALAGSRILSSFVSQISPLDPITYLFAAAGFVTVSVFAGYPGAPGGADRSD